MKLLSRINGTALLACLFLPGLHAIPDAAASDMPARSKRHPAQHRQIRSDADGNELSKAYRDLSRGQLNQAEKEYQAVLTKRPHEKDALLGLAVIYQRKLQSARAARLYRQVLNEDMGNATAAAGLISLSIPADPVAAESQLKELLDIRPASPELQYALGSALAFQQRLGEAQQAFYIAYSLAPDSALYAYNLAVSLDRLNQPKAALSYYEKSLRLSNTDKTLFDADAVKRRISKLTGQPLQERVR